MNIPYVKQYDGNGMVTNPIKGSYLNFYPNRKKRREKIKEIKPSMIQLINCRDPKTKELTGEIKYIKHYSI